MAPKTVIHRIPLRGSIFEQAPTVFAFLYHGLRCTCAGMREDETCRRCKALVELAKLEAIARKATPPIRLRPFLEWDEEDDGPVLWTTLPIEEPPYCGTPFDSGWPFGDVVPGGILEETMYFVLLPAPFRGGGA